MDRETESYWSHITGEALLGEMKGKHLKNMPAVHTTWSRWIADHPQTRVLKKDKTVSSSQYENYFKDPDKVGIFRAEWLKERLPAKKLVHGLTHGPHALAVTAEKLEKDHLIQTELDTGGVIVVKNTDGGVRAYSTNVDKTTLTFNIGDSPGVFKDAGTGSSWDLGRGECTGGALKGKKLEELTVTAAFWFAWSGFYPNTAVID